MKKFSKILSVALLVALVLSLGITNAFAADPTYKVTIDKSDSNDTATHVYEAYQIFAGKVVDNQLTEITWGSGVNPTALASALVTKFGSNTTATTKVKTPAVAADPDNNVAAADATYYTIGEAFTAAQTVGTAAAYAEAIGLLPAALVEDLADVIGENLNASNAIQGDNTGVADLAPGYYMVKDKDNSLEGTAYGAYTKYILNIVGVDVSIKEKAEVPSVDKTVQDETTDAEAGATDGYGDSADHAINESFKFKVVATIPADVELEDYETYMAKFTDTMSVGVTFEELDSVQINNHSVDAYAVGTNENGYKFSGVTDQTFTLEITDIKPYLTDDEMKAAVTVTVIYSAHLNENAIVAEASENEGTDNSNKVKLTYSNNADAYGDGEYGTTPEDFVWVFTFDVENTKYADKVDAANVLAGAGFTLYDSSKAVVKLAWNETKHAYIPDSENGVEEIFSKNDGTFNIIGLDAGTYTLKETTVPTGYNALEDITIKITATHVENTSGASAKLTLTETNTDNDVVNNSGTVLPSTGGIGTTIFYAVGGILVLAAVVLLVTKKRMSE